MQIGENTSLRGRSGLIYTLGKEVGAGGEGHVYQIQNQRLVAKIYNKVEGDIEKKITYMVNHPISNVRDDSGKEIMALAWPLDILRDSSGAFVGYIMPFIEKGVDIYNIARGCDTAEAKAMFPKYTWEYNLVTAINLARAVAHLHAYGCIIGDMNSKNIKVGAGCCIILLDNDSFELHDASTGDYFKCTAGTQEYLAPELQGVHLRDKNVRFTKESDCFSLAIHIFQLLMGNYHPFTGKNLVELQNSSAVNQQLDNIQNGRCPFVRQVPNLAIPVAAPYLEEMVSPQLVADFKRTFTYDARTLLTQAKQRVSADEWFRDLFQFWREPRTQCGRDHTHYYPTSMGRCGLCAAQARYEAYKRSLTSITPGGGGSNSGGNNPPPKSHSSQIIVPSTSGPAPSSGSGAKIALLLIALAILLLGAYMYADYQDSPASLPKSDRPSQSQSDTPSSGKTQESGWLGEIDGKGELDNVFGWETEVYALNHPIVGCESMTIDYTADIDGDKRCFFWTIYARTTDGWKNIGSLFLPKGTGSGTEELSLDGSMYIDAIAIYPDVEGELSWSEEIRVYNVQQSGSMSEKQEPATAAPAAQGGEVKGHWDDTPTGINDWLVYAYTLDTPMRNCRGFSFSFHVEFEGNEHVENWKLYIKTPSGWRSLMDIKMSAYEDSVDKTVSMDGTMTVQAIALVPSSSFTGSASQTIYVYDAK